MATDKTTLERVFEAYALAGDPEVLEELSQTDSEARQVAEELHRLANKKIDLRKIPGLEQFVDAITLNREGSTAPHSLMEGREAMGEKEREGEQHDVSVRERVPGLRKDAQSPYEEGSFSAKLTSEALGPWNLLEHSYTIGTDAINWFDERIRHGNQVVGRERHIEAIEAFLDRPERRGSLHIQALPGIGKSGLLEKFVSVHPDCVRHFIRTKESPVAVLQNLCAQLTLRFDLPAEERLPHDLADMQCRFERVRCAVSQRLLLGGKAVIVIDALDELPEKHGWYAGNLLELPRDPEPGIFFLLSSRPGERRYRINDTEHRIEKTDPDHRAAIRTFIRNELVNSRIQQRMAQASIEPKAFMEQLERKSEYNFMYLHCVFEELKDPDVEQPLDLDQLPQGYLAYYHDHWRRLWERVQQSRQAMDLLLRLAECAEPLSCDTLVQELSLPPGEVSKMLRLWRMFLERKEVKPGLFLYSFYHKTYHEFLLTEKWSEIGGVSAHKAIGDRMFEEVFDV